MSDWTVTAPDAFIQLSNDGNEVWVRLSTIQNIQEVSEDGDFSHCLIVTTGGVVIVDEQASEVIARISRAGRYQ